MASRIKIWQWPNVLGLDAAAIAMAWMGVFAAYSEGNPPDAATYLVLGLSVWLTYLADRLLDVQNRPMHRLLSKRHRFAKRNRILLWRLWLLVLLFAFALAVFRLNPTQLWKGTILLCVCLAYTVLNQLLSKAYFPKEIFVAGIFAAGTQIFITGANMGPPVLLFGLLCLINCLLIAEKEKAVDARLRVQSAMGQVPFPVLGSVALIAFALEPMSSLGLTLFAPGIALALLFYFRQLIEVEAFRVLCDAVLLLGPAVYFFA